MAAADGAVAILQRGEDPGFANPLDDVRRKCRRTAVSRLLAIQYLGQVCGQPAGIDLEMPQDGGDIVVRTFDQLEQPMFDFDIVMRTRQGQTDCAFKRGARMRIQATNQGLQIDVQQTPSPLRWCEATKGCFYAGILKFS